MSGYPCRLILCLPLWWIVSAHAAPELPIWAAASWRNDIATVRAHIAAGTNIDTLDDWTGKTALHYAAEYGNLEIAELLLNNGADGGDVVAPTGSRPDRQLRRGVRGNNPPQRKTKD